MNEHSQLQRLDAQISMLEQKVQALLDGIEVAIEEMPLKERVNIAVKLAALCQRYMVLRQRYEKEEESSSRNNILQKLMQQMRGELPEDSSDSGS
jgi:pheromone shutdown protein TraB